MNTINSVKQLAEADTPLLFFECVMPSGDTQYWSTHSISFNENTYSARVLKHNLFDLQLSADDAMDGISQLSLTLANADSALSELNAAVGFKGSQLTVYFAFADLIAQTITTESTVLFRGTAGDPDEITEDSLALTFTNKLSLQRIPVPEVRIQRSCPWNFPATPDQRVEATNGGANGVYSRWYRCGYSADQPSGVGNLSTGGQAFTTCDKSRGQCQQRGMFDKDASGNMTRRFGAFEFVPSAIMVRTSGDKTSHLSPLLDNAAMFNDPVPLVYGTGWLKAPVIFARNDGNLTHMEVLLGLGPLQGVLKVVVNDIEIPSAPGNDPTTTGWYAPVSSGTRQGNFNLDFTDSSGNPLGDPYGNLCVLSVVVPNRISSGASLPNVEVLLQGLQIDTYIAGVKTTGFSDNPAWVILDLLRRCGWSMTDINLATFETAAAFCQELISTTDLNGNAIQVPRYKCNLVLTKRQSAATVIRGIRVASSLMLRYGSSGLLELLPETTIARQQSTPPDGTNSVETVNGGWPAYEFSDSTAPFSGIARDASGASTVRLLSRSIAETSNRLSVEFQDESNEYQQDSLSLVDSVDSALIGYEITSQSTALGIANFSQATRVLLRQLDKSTKGNSYVQFQTSFRALKVRPGDIIAMTYFKEGLTRALFRVTKLSPSMNYQMVTVLGQIHVDDWYSDNPAVLGGAGRQPGTNIQVPRPLIGTIAHPDPNAPGAIEFFDFAIQEKIQAAKDGSATDTLSVLFTQPVKPSPSSPNVPLVSLSPEYDPNGGTLPGATSFYYAVSAVDSSNNEGPLSFTVPAVTPTGTNTNSVTILNLSFPNIAASFHVYRGVSPQVLYRIASSVPISSSYTDTGAQYQPIGPPDASYDHANFYYRYQYTGQIPVTIFSPNTVGWEDLGASPGAYAGMVVRILEGPGRGQERSIATNDQTTLTVTPAWSVLPANTSTFAVVEPSWRFGAVSVISPAQFEIPYQAGTFIQVSGRAANVNNVESDAELCPLTVWALGGGNPDVGVAPAPDFSLEPIGGGEINLFGIGFDDLTNTSSVSSGTLQLFYWREIDRPSLLTLPAPIDASTDTLSLQGGLPGFGDVIQLDSELMTVLSVDTGSNTCTVLRGALGSIATTHNANDTVLDLKTSVIIVPFASDFFQSKASGNFLHTFSLPDVRISAAEFFVTNSFGDGQTGQRCYTLGPDGGLRTLSGGQFAIQVAGYLATQQNAAPPLTVQQTHAVRDIRATVGQAPAGYDIAITIQQNGSPYCSLAINSGSVNSSSVIDGVSLSPLQEAANITLDVALNPVSGYTGAVTPGMDLTVTIRF
jgi:hypothetical protein